MKICFFGIYNPEYSRNRVLISGLKQNNVEVIECRVNPKVGKFFKYWNLYKEYKKIKNQKIDYIIVAFPGHTVVWLARLLFGRKIIFDAFTSLYDSEVMDRKNVKKGSLKAKYLWFLDQSSCRLANKVLLDTNEHIKYFVSEFGLKKDRFIRVFVGTESDLEENLNNDLINNKFKISFYGSNIPLQGVNYILESAKILEKEDIEFDIIGSGIKRQYGEEKISNVNFLDNLSYTKLMENISKADVCLGIFGKSNKAQRAIPNKVYDCVSLKKPVITADTLAIRELFGDRDLFMVPVASPKRISEAILILKNNPEIRKTLSENAYKKFKENCIPKIIVKNLLKELEY